MEESFSGSEQGHERSDSEDIKLINEAVSDINDSFTLLRTIDTDIIENFCETSKDLSSDGSDNNPSYKLPKDNQEDSSTDEDVPLSFVPRGKHFYKSKYKNTSKVGQHPRESEHNIIPSESVSSSVVRPSSTENVTNQDVGQIYQSPLKMQNTSSYSELSVNEIQSLESEKKGI